MNIRLLSHILLIVISLNSQAQTKKKYYKIEKDIEKLGNRQSELRKAAKGVYHDNINNKIRSTILNSYLEAYHFTTFEGKEVVLGEHKSPSILLVSSYVNEASISQLFALHKTAEDYKGKMQFFVLYNKTSKHDSLFKAFSDFILFIPLEAKESNENILSLKGFNYWGMPTVLALNNERKVINFYSGALFPLTLTLQNGEKKTYSDEDAFYKNFTDLKKCISAIFKE
jgi:hypothetical protein